MIRAGLIGCGMISNAHRAGYRNIAKDGGNVVLEAICDIRPEMLENACDNARTYTSVDEMLKKEKGKLDYVDICVPTFLHAEIAIKAMEAGFHVMSEKPMARTVEQAERMLETSRRTGKKLMIAHCSRFSDAVRIIKQTIESGELGKLRSGQFFWEGGSREPMGWNNWYQNGELSGGAVLDLQIHAVDIMRCLFGMPQAVSTGAASVMTKNGYDAMSGNIYFENNVFVNTISDWTIAHDKFNTRCYRVNFEKGYIIRDTSPNRQVFVKVAEDGTVTDYFSQIGFDGYREEIEYFADCIANDKPVEYNPPEESLDAVRIALAQIESADRGGERITV